MLRCLGLVSLIFALTTTGCATMESGNGESGSPGAGLGKVLGGIIGKSSEKKTEPSSFDATAGGAAGESVRDYMDQQEKELHQTLALLEGTTLQRVENNLAVTLQSDIFFDMDSSDIREDTAGKLDHIAGLLQKYSHTRVEIGGYTDSTGSEEHNLQLSQRRAQAVAAALTTRGVAAERITTRGFGESGPVASNATDTGRQKNRRVTLFIIPKAM